MQKKLIAALCLQLLMAPAWSQTDVVTESVPEQILVVGKRPGPGLWKISKDDHVLWVFGTYSPLPKNMQWRSHEVESILAQSQEYIAPPSAGAKVGVFKSLTLLPHVVGFQNLPDDKRLSDVLPADVYARWLPFKAKYYGDKDSIERQRPMFVASDLFRMALFNAGLSRGSEVSEAIYKLAQQSKVKITTTAINVDLDSPGKVMKEFKKASLDDVDCFVKTLERLDTDMDAMRVRANAWAIGDVAVIEKLSFGDRDHACKAVMTNSTWFKNTPELAAMEERAHAAWLAAAEKALATNASTFSQLPISKILDPYGLVAALQAKGYRVDKPE